MRSGRRTGTRVRKAERGATLIEALITLLVMSIGLLGMAALQLIGIQENTSALRHSQATWFAYDMADRMRANLDPNANPEDVADLYVGDVRADGSCTQPDPRCDESGSDCDTAQMAAFDTFRWCQLIAQLPGGEGSIAEDAVGGRYLIQVLWKDDARTGSTASVEITVDP